MRKANAVRGRRRELKAARRRSRELKADHFKQVVDALYVGGIDAASDLAMLKVMVCAAR